MTKVKDVLFKEALGSRYLSYALSTIMARSLPDVRDGLKPVHRRLLYAMRELKLNPKGGHKKSARIVGDVIGKYHPHGELAIYGTLVRLAQDFTLRFPLIDGQGNFGNIDGDNAAAMRYTEAKLTEVAEVMMEGLDQDAVDFKDTYDGEFSEPIVLPSRFPNLLANGSEGIAVGMATSIPPHNVDELCQAAIRLIDKPSASVDDLMEFVQGPDLPTGGDIIESPETIREAYRTGRGSFRVRAKYEIEQKKGGLYQIVITEIPYQVPKTRIIEKIADLILAKKIPLLTDVQDESAQDIRIVLTPKSRQVDPEVLMNVLFKNTDLESRVSLNMNVVDKNNVPGVMNLQQVLSAFLEHRLVVLKRQTKFRLGQIDRRLEILEGYITVYVNLDEVIRIIREEDDPKEKMIARWGLTDLQAESILNMRLRSLRRLEEIELKKEHEGLSAEKVELLTLLEDDKNCWKAIKTDLRDVRKRFGETTELGKRRTQFKQVQAQADVPLEAMIERESITVIFSKKGWIRSVKGHLDEAGVTDLKFKDGDSLKQVLHTYTTDFLLVFGSNGRFYTVLADKIQRGRGFGDPIRLLCDMSLEDEILSLQTHDRKAPKKLLLVSTAGRGFMVSAEDVFAQTKGGKQVMNVKTDSKPLACQIIDGHDRVALVGHNRRLLVLSLEEIPSMTRGQGVILQKYSGGGLSDLKLLMPEEPLSWQKGKRTYREENTAHWLGRRGNAGRFAPDGFPRTNKFK